MNIYQTQIDLKYKDHTSAAEAIQEVEQAGHGQVTRFFRRPNLPNCLPEWVDSCSGLWSYRDGQWNHHYIYDGWGNVIDHSKPN